jgi:hypothetical protein
MVVSLDPRSTHAPTVGEMNGLWAYLQLAVGQPFRFLRSSYADEVTLHLGAEVPPVAPKRTPIPLKLKPRGSYVLTFRGSAWMIHSHAGMVILASPLMLPAPPFPMPSLPTSGIWQPVTLEELERVPPITPGAFLLHAFPYQDDFTQGFGLVLGFSDRSSVNLRPTPEETSAAGEQELPPIADWELFTPYGRYLRVGPGQKWAYEPSGQEGEQARNGVGQPPSTDQAPAH